MPSEVSIAGGDRDREPTADELERELEHAREQQAATADILRLISGSPTDLQRVFAVVAASAARLCEAYDATIYQVDADVLRLVAHHGPIQIGPVGQFTLPLIRGLLNGRAVLNRQVIQVTDLQAEGDEYPGGRDFATRFGFRTLLAVPLLRAGHAIGVISIRRAEVRPFTDRQIGLLKTFADQAVIAIENVRLLKELQEKNDALTEAHAQVSGALERETATSEILRVIGSSPTDVQPVFDTIARSGVSVCGALGCVVLVVDGDMVRMAATHGVRPERLERFRRDYPVPLAAEIDTAQTIRHRCIFHLADIEHNPNATAADIEHARLAGYRTRLMVPMVRGDRTLGLIAVTREDPTPFPDQLVELLKTFADQAVIAIENTRLFEEVQARTKELTESLESQTATSSVLNVISRSKFDLQPVLDAIAETAARLCVADMCDICRRTGDTNVYAASYGATPDYAEYYRATLGLPVHGHDAGRGSIVGRVLLEGKSVQIPDVLADPEYTLHEMQRRGNYRTVLGVPLLREGVQIGIILLMRHAVQPFTDKQIELTTTFSDQAVIAIENTRLFEEVQARTRELAKTVQDLEIASQHKSQFVANMSHELRTPLAAMLGYAELLQEGIYGLLPEKSLPILTRIRSNGKHLLGLINTVLDISKIEAGQFKLNLAEYALGSIVETVMVATESLAATKKLAFKTEVAEGLPYGLGDEQRLTQVLLNLVGNAIKFTDAGEVRITAGAANGHFALSVSDTGPGIPPEECQRIFEKFRQIDSSNTRAKDGTGLGLAIAKEIVEMHGGRIWAESTVGEGSTFRMELPVRAVVPAGAV